MQFAGEISCMKARSPLFIFLFLGLAGMLVLNGFLYNKNAFYKHQNKALIIQNDSILSANIELKQELERQRALSENKLSMRRKAASKK